MVDGAGTPTGSALTFLAMPAALAAAGIYVVAAAEDGLAVFDRLSGECVQQMTYGAGIVAAPGQQVLTADDAGGSCIAVAGRRVVRCCMDQPWTCRRPGLCHCTRLQERSHARLSMPWFTSAQSRRQTCSWSSRVPGKSDCIVLEKVGRVCLTQDMNPLLLRRQANATRRCGS